jgi:hypothetical protein
MFVEAGDLEGLPLGRLEAEIASLAAHVNAGTCRFLHLVAEFDRRAGWERWGCGSCAEWLSWRCGLAPRSAREHVRVATRLRELPRVSAAFARGELSFSQVRAISRVAGPGSEETLLELARHATAAQLERVVRAFRGVLATELAAVDRAYEQRYLIHSCEEDGSLVLHGRLPADEGAVVLAALAAGRDALRAQEAPAGSAELKGDPDGSAEPPRRAGNADALVLMAESLLASPAQRTGGERHQVVVHVDTSALTGDDPAGRCQLEQGPALHPETARRLACDASLVRILESDGRPLSVGRRTRSIPPALRRALGSRDGGCRFPGCTRHRFVDAHHVEHWSRGGATDLDNLVTLCRRHHRLVHEGGFAVERRARGGFAFRRPDGRLIPHVPPRPAPGAQAPAGLPRIEPQASASRWNGDPLDLGAAVDAVTWADRRTRPRRLPPPGGP